MARSPPNAMSQGEAAEPPVVASSPAPIPLAGRVTWMSALTVRLGEIGSHMKIGWQDWTRGVVRALYRSRIEAGQEMPVAWLWGKPAQEFFDAAVQGLPVPPERVLRSRHPSNDFRQEFVQQAAAHLAQLQRLLDPPIRW